MQGHDRFIIRLDWQSRSESNWKPELSGSSEPFFRWVSKQEDGKRQTKH